jgi:hypothetical protein
MPPIDASLAAVPSVPFLMMLSTTKHFEVAQIVVAMVAPGHRLPNCLRNRFF